jgi:Fe-S-cluster-containing dehydrogenase component
MKRIYVIESLCNGCRLCQTFCSSLSDGVFSAEARVRVIKTAGEEQDIPVVDCSGNCIEPVFESGIPTCVSVCPTGALVYEDRQGIKEKRLILEEARQAKTIFKVVSPWKWPFPWKSEQPSGEFSAGKEG